MALTLLKSNMSLCSTSEVPLVSNDGPSLRGGQRPDTTDLPINRASPSSRIFQQLNATGAEILLRYLLAMAAVAPLRYARGPTPHGVIVQSPLGCACGVEDRRARRAILDVYQATSDKTPRMRTGIPAQMCRTAV
jgi:hypothetical protein